MSLNNGQLLGAQLKNNKFWILERIGRVASFQNMIYSLGDQTLKEIDSETGKILRYKNLEQLEHDFDFIPTGEHKVYDDYIFIMTVGKPGKVAILDRKTFEFINMVKINGLIPLGKDHLHWHNNRLFILDFSGILHIYEDPSV